MGDGSRRWMVLLLQLFRLIELQGQISALGLLLRIYHFLHRPGRSSLHCRVLSICCILFVFNSPVEDQIGRHLRDKAIDKANNLPACDNLRINEVTMQVEDQVNNLGRIHALLNVASKGHLVNADLVGEAIKLVLKAQFRWLVFDTKVDRLYDRTWRESSERLDAALRFGVHRAIVVNVE